jgi:hypothetical protein
MKTNLTIRIPDDLASNLEDVAGAQRKSAEQLAIESLRNLFDATDSPQALLRRIRALPHPKPEAVDDMEAAIAAAGPGRNRLT